MPTAGKVTWLGHASALIELADQRLLVDPLGRRRTRDSSPDAILITHAHVDHLNRWTLSALPKETPLFVPHGASPALGGLGFHSVTEVEPGDQVTVGGVNITAVETRHDPGRFRKGDGPICAGYVMSHGSSHIHHAGDVDFSDFSVFDDIGKRFPLSATLLPIGGMLPVWWYRWRRAALDRGVHIDPDTALALSERLGARSLVPIHWGTVSLRLGPTSGPKTRLQRVAQEQDKTDLVRVLAHGETMTL